MQAIILAAGYGTRLYPLTQKTAKALLPINGKPLLEYAIDKLEYNPHIDTIFIVVNDFFYKDFLAWKKKLKSGKKVVIINDGTRSNETRIGGIMDLMLPMNQYKVDDDVLVVLGDNFFDFSLDPFIEKAVAKKEAALLAYDVKDKQVAKRFGVVEINHQRQIVSIEEKPSSPKSTYIITGCYYFPRKHISFIRDYSKSDSNKEGPTYVLYALLQKKKPVFAVVEQGLWFDIGTVEQYEELKRRLSS